MKTPLWILATTLGLSFQPIFILADGFKGGSSGSSYGGSYGNTSGNSGSYGNTPVNAGSYGNTPINSGSYGSSYVDSGYGFTPYVTGFYPYGGASAVYPSSSFPGLMMSGSGYFPRTDGLSYGGGGGGGYSMRGMKPYNSKRSGTGAYRSGSNASGARGNNNDLNDFLGMGGGSNAGSYGAFSRPKVYKPLSIPGKPSASVNGARKRSQLPGEIAKLPERNPSANANPIDVARIQNVSAANIKKPNWIANQNSNAAVQKGIEGQVVRMSSWKKDNPDRDKHWQNWGDDVRYKWRWHQHHNHWFTGDWWYHHGHGIGHWHYYNQFNYYPWSFWWTYPTWNTVGTWFNWNVPVIWGSPIFYDYGSGGNVVYQGNNVLVNGQNVGTPADFAQSAAVLASIGQPDADPANLEWLPLGTFAVSTNESDLNPTRMLQLAVDRNGIIAGTLYNIQSDQAQSIQGRVDKDTQRVAFQFGDAPNVVAETGIYNLTQDAAPLLVHYGADRVEVYNLIRLTAPDQSR
jgi:hypothetical protein